MASRGRRRLDVLVPAQAHGKHEVNLIVGERKVLLVLQCGLRGAVGIAGRHLGGRVNLVEVVEEHVA